MLEMTRNYHGSVRMMQHELFHFLHASAMYVASGSYINSGFKIIKVTRVIYLSF